MKQMTVSVEVDEHRAHWLWESLYSSKEINNVRVIRLEDGVCEDSPLPGRPAEYVEDYSRYTAHIQLCGLRVQAGSAA